MPQTNSHQNQENSAFMKISVLSAVLSLGLVFCFSAWSTELKSASLPALSAKRLPDFFAALETLQGKALTEEQRKILAARVAQSEEIVVKAHDEFTDGLIQAFSSIDRQKLQLSLPGFVRPLSDHEAWKILEKQIARPLTFMERDRIKKMNSRRNITLAPVPHNLAADISRELGKTPEQVNSLLPLLGYQ